MAQNTPRGTPGRVMVILTLLTGGVMVSAWRDALNRKTNEWVRHPTALGDTAILQPTQLPALLSTGGKTVSLQAGQTIFHRRDDKMFRVLTGLDVPLPFTLYTAHENLAAHAEPKLYARTAPHQYLPLHARLANESPTTPPPSSAPTPRQKPASPANEAEPFAAAPSPPPIPSPPSPPGLGPGPGPGPAAPETLPVTPSATTTAAASRTISPTAPPKIIALPKPATPPPQVPPGEDPDKALALPASKTPVRPNVSSASTTPPGSPAAAPVAAPKPTQPAAVPPAPIALPRTDKPPVIRRAEPVPEDEPTPAPAAPKPAPKAIPLPPEEQDSPVPAPSKGAL